MFVRPGNSQHLPPSPHWREPNVKHRAQKGETTWWSPQRQANRAEAPAFWKLHRIIPRREELASTAERSLPLETVSGKLEALTLRMSPTRGMFFLLSLIAWVHPDPPHPKLHYQGPQIKCLRDAGRERTMLEDLCGRYGNWHRQERACPV